MLTYTDLKPGTKFILEGDPYVVLDYTFKKKQRQKPTVQTKIRNLISGSIVEKAFTQNDTIKEADIEEREVKYLYTNPKNNELWFCAPDNPGDRFNLEKELVGDGIKFMKENSIVKAQVFQDKIIGVVLPIKIDLKVIEAPPAVRGNTAQGVTKQVKLETGSSITVPIFINEGDIVRINTEKDEYVERVEKA